MHQAVRKHGWDEFEISILENEVPIEQLNQREMHWIAELRTKRPAGYNLTDGGKSSSGWSPSPETKQRISERAKQRTRKPHSTETKQKIGASQKGKIISEESRAKMRESAKNRDRSTYKGCSRPGQTNPNYGRKRSQEEKMHVSDLRQASRSTDIYKITRPDGTVDSFKNMNEYCRQHALDDSGIRRLRLKQVDQYKGFTNLVITTDG